MFQGGVILANPEKMPAIFAASPAANPEAATS